MANFGIRIALFLTWCVSFLPVKVISWIGSLVGVITYHMVSKRRKVGIKNLSLCFPDMSEAEKERIIREHFKYISKSGIEYSMMFYASKERIKKLVSIKNFHFLEQYYKKRPVILLCPHFVGLDIGASRLNMEIEGYSLFSLQKNNMLGERLKKARLRFSGPETRIFSRQEGLRTIIRELKRSKLIFYYLPDQDFGERDSIYTSFFAQDSCATITTLPKLAKLTNAVIIPMITYRVGDHYEVNFYEAWDNYPTDNIENDVIRMNKFIEDVVLKALPQYYWLHKRFKTQPNQERGNIYKDL